MRYNPDTNRYRNVNAQALGRLLDADMPIDCCGKDRAAKENCVYGAHTQSSGAKLASSCPGEPSLAMVYSPYQHFREIYTPYEALCHGTLFRELDKPWKAGGCR